MKSEWMHGDERTGFRKTLDTSKCRKGENLSICVCMQMHNSHGVSVKIAEQMKIRTTTTANHFDRMQVCCLLKWILSFSSAIQEGWLETQLWQSIWEQLILDN